MTNSRSLMESMQMQVGSRVHESNLREEMEELRKLTTETMMAKCLKKSEVVVCPKPRKRQISFRQCGENVDQKVAAELSDIFMSKASPPFFSGSPPVRVSNPLIRDARFCEQKAQPNPSPTVLIEIPVNRSRRTRSVLTMA